MSGNPKHTPIRRKLRRDSTFPERLLWSKLRRKQTGYKFRRQESLGPYITDFFCHEKGIVIEVDGDYHALEIFAEKDKKRDEYLQERGYEVLRYSTQEVSENLDGVVIDIMKHCRNRKN